MDRFFSAVSPLFFFHISPSTRLPHGPAIHDRFGTARHRCTLHVFRPSPASHHLHPARVRARTPGCHVVVVPVEAACDTARRATSTGPDRLSRSARISAWGPSRDPERVSRPRRRIEPPVGWLPCRCGLTPRCATTFRRAVGCSGSALRVNGAAAAGRPRSGPRRPLRGMPPAIPPLNATLRSTSGSSARPVHPGSSPSNWAASAANVPSRSGMAANSSCDVSPGVALQVRLRSHGSTRWTSPNSCHRYPSVSAAS